jgi:hypothetical protein
VTGPRLVPVWLSCGHSLLFISSFKPHRHELVWCVRCQAVSVVVTKNRHGSRP